MKNIQTINKLTARELNLNEELVELVNGFFWKEVRRKLSSLESTSVSIKHLGTITTSKRKIDQFIKTTIKKIRNIRKSNRYKETTKELLLEVNLDKLRKALVQRNQLAKQYYEAYFKRITRVRVPDANNLQTSTEDTGRDSERGEGTTELPT
jgi:phage protein D